MSGPDLLPRRRGPRRALQAVGAWWQTNFWANMSWSEASGAMGDLGTFLPLTLALAQFNGLDLGTTLAVTGMYNLFSGAIFQVPMPVQPMKSIAAIALSENPLSVPQMVAAGMSVSAIVLVLGATGLIDVFNWLVPICVIRGMQLGLGLKLAEKGIQSVTYLDGSKTDMRAAWGLEGYLLGCGAAVFILLATLPREQGCIAERSSGANVLPDSEEAEQLGCSHNLRETEPAHGHARGAAPCCRGPSIPVALMLICGGLVLGIAGNPAVLQELKLGPSFSGLVLPSPEDWKEGFIRGAIPQLPLTTLNSVVAVCHLSEELFPSKPVGPRKIAISVGLMNLAGGCLGTMPCCHGAGGLAAQVKFGAGSGAAVMLLGAVKLVIGLAFGNSLLSLLQEFPSAILGSMLIFSGAELAMSARKQEGEVPWCIMLLTAATVLLGSTALGFVVGLVMAGLVAVVAAPWGRWWGAVRRGGVRSWFDQETYQSAPSSPPGGDELPLNSRETLG